MGQLIIGFDLARAYAIFGMFIVNFNFSFGSIMSPSDSVGHFLNIFTGNSTAIFIICAGMGVSLMTTRNMTNVEERAKIKSVILKRSWFLFALGLILYNWWSGDILHFYGGYMHMAAFLIFIPTRYYLTIAISIILVFHILLYFIPIESGWDFTTFKYNDFWTLIGFLRNTIYNGWNSIFPWFAYFVIGMWLGHRNWTSKLTRRHIFITGLFMFTTFQALRFVAQQQYFSPFLTNYIMAEYFPPYLPFMILTMGYAFMVISFCMLVGEKFSNNSLVLALQKTGQMTLTHYVIHLTFGMILLANLTHKHYTGLLEDEIPTQPWYILVYSIVFYVFSVLFSVMWAKKFKQGPLEALMRKISN